MRRTLLVVTAVLLVLMLSFAVTGCRKTRTQGLV
jgi:predicted small secreted protein